MKVDDKYGKPKGSITLTRDEFGKDLWTKVGELLGILTKAGYMAKVYDDEPNIGIVVIEFGYSDEEMGDELIWFDSEKYFVDSWSNDTSST